MNTSPKCRHLRAKSMFIPALAEPDPHQSEPGLSSGGTHYWCNCTLSEAGPDDRPVNAQVCQSSRSCFEE